MASGRPSTHSDGSMGATNFPILLTLDDLDPKGAKVSKLATSRNSGSSSIRLAVLLAILIPLAVFGYLHNRYTSSIQRIEKSLAMWDDQAALREIKKLEKDFLDIIIFFYNMQRLCELFLSVLSLVSFHFKNIKSHFSHFNGV